MPKNPTKAKRSARSRKRPVTRARGANNSPARAASPKSGRNGRSDPNHREGLYVVDNGRPTHVLVPIHEYEELIKSGMVARAVAQIESGDDDFVDANDFALVVAAERIAQARKAKGLTQKQLGEKLNLPQSQISRIERNPDHTTVRTLKRIARALGVDVAALV